jgi:hypothetical protein
MFRKFKGYDVMLESVTVASMAMLIYKKMFLKEEVLTIVPEGGYEKLDRYVRNLLIIKLYLIFRASSKAIKYFEWRCKNEGLTIQHAGNGSIIFFVITMEYLSFMNLGEKKFGHYKVDGWIEDQNKAIEFLGCYYHGHLGNFEFIINK